MGYVDPEGHGDPMSSCAPVGCGDPVGFRDPLGCGDRKGSGDAIPPMRIPWNWNRHSRRVGRPVVRTEVLADSVWGTSGLLHREPRCGRPPLVPPLHVRGQPPPYAPLVAAFACK